MTWIMLAAFVAAFAAYIITSEELKKTKKALDLANAHSAQAHAENVQLRARIAARGNHIEALAQAELDMARDQMEKLRRQLENEKALVRALEKQVIRQ